MNLTMHYKAVGRSYIYKGQDLTNSPWYLLDENGTRYEDQTCLPKEQPKKPEVAKVVKPKAVVKKKEVIKED